MTAGGFSAWVLSEIFRRSYAAARRAPGTSFATRALHVLDIHVTASGCVTDLPASGPLIVVANHPHGIADGLVLTHVLQQRRRDVRVLTNHLLAGLAELSELCLFVDPSRSKTAAARSGAGLRAAVKWLRDGHALIVFPAGEVSHINWSSGTPIDSEWHDTAARLGRRTHAHMIAAHIDGRNSHRFYALGRLHSGLRTLQLPLELLRMRGRTVRVRLGRPLADVPATAAETTAMLRQAAERLAREGAQDEAGEAGGLPSPPDRLDAEVRALSAEHLLVQGRRLSVYCAPAAHIPGILQEIGRLREMTFRDVGEGTGNDTDLDRFDRHYLHLFAWNHERREVVGAYRLGRTDTILASHGIAGLYTSTLFRYDERLMAQLSPAIELGRSFVRAEYQRSPDALLALWKGIAQFVIRAGYRVLFGPVSISNRYTDSSQRLLMSFLEQNARHCACSELVEAVNPPRLDATFPCGVDPRTISSARDLDQWVMRMEADGKGVPVLLRQYLRLNAKLLGFNVDPAFGDVLDALMMVDLRDVDPAILARYAGKDLVQLVGRRSLAA